MNTPKPGQRWIHQNGNSYEVVMIANADSDRPEYPATVVYRGEDWKVWSKPLDDFMAKMSIPVPGEWVEWGGCEPFSKPPVQGRVEVETRNGTKRETKAGVEAWWWDKGTERWDHLGGFDIVRYRTLDGQKPA